MDLDDLHLRFESAAGGRWQVVAECESTGTTARAFLRSPVLPAPLARAWAGICVAHRDIERSGVRESASLLQEIGERLFQAACADDVGGCLRAGLEHARRRGRGLRIWIHASGQEELDRLPWEALFDPRDRRFFAQSEATPIVRHLEVAEPLKQSRLKKPLRVLLPTACPADRQPIGAASELGEITRALEAAEEAGDVVLEPLAGATLEKLRRRLDRSDPPCHVVHFIGHAGFDPAVRDGVLVLEDGSGASQVVGARHLGPLLLDHDPLLLLVLNACEGARRPVEGTSPGLAQALMRQRIPAVLAMQTRICDPAAIAFSRHFYSALAAGCAVDVALSRCRKAMFSGGQEVAWAAPVLYLRSAQAPLLPGRRGRGGEAATAAGKAAGVPARSGAGTAGPDAGSRLWRRGWRRAGLGAAALLAGLGCLWLVLYLHGRPQALTAGGDRTARTGWTGERQETRRSPAATAASMASPEVSECPPAPELAMKFMRLGPGTFLMGSPHGGAADERPAHFVTLSPFCMSAYEVTQTQWRRVLGEAADQSSRHGDDLPVENVAWDDVQVFLGRLNGLAGRVRYRLPTEAEWEYAARAGSGAAYSFGDDPGELYRFGNCKSLEHDDGFDRTAPVGSFAPNRWGLFDLYGNVSEWVEDAYGRYDAGPVQGPHVLAGVQRVRRGGSWKIVAKNCRSAFRNKSMPDYRRDDVGFRLVRLAD